MSDEMSSSPPPPVSNPGQGSQFRIALANEQGSWEEAVDLRASLAGVLQAKGYDYEIQGDGLILPDGLALQPQIVSCTAADGGGVRTATTIEVRHADLVPAGIFEFQHAVGDDVAGTIAFGFEQWAELDLVVMRDALQQDELAHCMALQMELPAQPPHPAVRRRALLGPTSHLAMEQSVAEEEHPFCPCCLFTNTFHAFRALLQCDQFFGLRLFATRDDQGKVDADCRVNGGDWAPGRQALMEYARGWPERGLEFRKQYVTLQSMAV